MLKKGFSLDMIDALEDLQIAHTAEEKRGAGHDGLAQT
jgi:hypothetical protein